MDAVPISKKIIAFGSKPIFLPKFTIALVRTPALSPYHARFLVPLNFSKYDLRDYLYHAYAIKVHNVRSFVKQQPVRDAEPRRMHKFRPESKKYMTVEMEKPFVWPEDPEDWEPWGKKEKEDQVEQQLRLQGAKNNASKREEARVLREQVREIMGSKVGEAERRVEEMGTERKKSLLELWEEKRSPQMLGRERETS